MIPVGQRGPRHNLSKHERIVQLAEWFKTGRIRFSDAIPCKDVINNEIIRFPKWHDDFLDTLRDQMENAEGGVISDVIAFAAPTQSGSEITGGFLGFSQGKEVWEGSMTPDTSYSHCDPMTGL
jgi:hypothetical protein